MNQTKKLAIENAKTHVYWVIVADGKQARVFACDSFSRIPSTKKSRRYDLAERRPEPRLMPLANETIKAESARDYSTGHDKRGSVFGSAVPARHTVEPHLDVRKEIRMHHVQRIAARLEEAWRQKLFDRVVIAAPQPMLGEIEKHVASVMRTCIVGTLAKNFSRCTAHQILPMVRQWLPAT